MCHKDIRSNVIMCSSNFEGFLKTLKVFLNERFKVKKKVQMFKKFIKRFKGSKLHLLKKS